MNDCFVAWVSVFVKHCFVKGSVAEFIFCIYVNTYLQQRNNCLELKITNRIVQRGVSLFIFHIEVFQALPLPHLL